MQLRLEWTYTLLKTKKEHLMNSEFMGIHDALALVNDLEKTGRLKGNVSFYDQDDSTWSKKELLRYLKQFETEPHDVSAYIDGGYDHSSKKSGIGIVIYYKQHHKRWRTRFNDQLQLLEDNNEAEYAALYRLIQQLESIGVHHQRVLIRLDSIVVQNQASGEWPCLEKNYISWLNRIDELSRKLGLTLHYEKIPRTSNKEADNLATQALKGIIIQSKIEKY